ncbi:MAG: PD-(D/E)XK nuclease family protein [Candidatus Aenigmarchaeota archaeon]|nr:PD-(D/E)XK nuclease family protein [Candidatus Aenigmarchaeota archaeon]
MNSYWRRKFAWSNSRHSQWQECKKQYYFNYIAKWDGLPGDPGRDKLYQLSDLQRLVFLKGSLLHEVIKQQINNQRVDRPVSAEAAKSFFISELERANSNQEKCITEAFNGFPIAEEEFKNIEIDGIKQIDNFCNIIWNNYKNVMYIDHEKNDMFSVDNINLRVKCDFLAKNNETFVVTDWKTGSEGFDDINESIQMSAYILWVHSKYKAPLDKIIGEVVYLKSCNSEIVKKSEKELKEFKEFILRSSQEMLEVNSEKDFPASPNRNCKGCNFATICEDGKKFLN